MTEIDDSIKALHNLAIKFRTNDDLNASLEMQNILNTIISNPVILINSNTNAISIILKLINECQIRNDWLGLADYLDYDFIQAISHDINTIGVTLDITTANQNP